MGLQCGPTPCKSCHCQFQLNKAELDDSIKWGAGCIIRFVRHHIEELHAMAGPLDLMPAFSPASSNNTDFDWGAAGTRLSENNVGAFYEAWTGFES